MEMDFNLKNLPVFSRSYLDKSFIERERDDRLLLIWRRHLVAKDKQNG